MESSWSALRLGKLIKSKTCVQLSLMAWKSRLHTLVESSLSGEASGPSCWTNIRTDRPDWFKNSNTRTIWGKRTSLSSRTTILNSRSTALEKWKIKTRRSKILGSSSSISRDHHGAFWTSTTYPSGSTCAKMIWKRTGAWERKYLTSPCTSTAL